MDSRKQFLSREHFFCRKRRRRTLFFLAFTQDEWFIKKRNNQIRPGGVWKWLLLLLLLYTYTHKLYVDRNKLNIFVCLYIFPIFCGTWTKQKTHVRQKKVGSNHLEVDCLRSWSPPPSIHHYAKTGSPSTNPPPSLLPSRRVLFHASPQCMGR